MTLHVRPELQVLAGQTRTAAKQASQLRCRKTGKLGTQVYIPMRVDIFLAFMPNCSDLLNVGEHSRKWQTGKTKASTVRCQRLVRGTSTREVRTLFVPAKIWQRSKGEVTIASNFPYRGSVSM